MGETPSPNQQLQSNKRSDICLDGDKSSSPNPKRRKKAIAHKSKKKRLASGELTKYGRVNMMIC